MAEALDERTLGVLDAPVRYPGDPSRYNPPTVTPRGYHVGRTIAGLHPVPSYAQVDCALQCFVPFDSNLAGWDDVILNLADHAQVHPAFKLDLHHGQTPGYGYWVHASFENMLRIAQRYLSASIDPAFEPIMMGSTLAVGRPMVHVRAIVPFGGDPPVPGTWSITPQERSDIIRIQTLDRSVALYHLDFNGFHIGTTVIEDVARSKCRALGVEFHPSKLHNAGMSAFVSTRVNVESYPVRVLDSEALAALLDGVY